MNKFAQWSINTQSVAVILGFVVLGLSLKPNPRRVLIMALCYAAISIAFGWAGIFRQFFEIRMAIAFGGKVPVFAYISPLLEAAFYLVPIYGLFVSPAAGRRIGFISFFIILPALVLIEIIALRIAPELGGRRTTVFQERGIFSIPHGWTALVLAALWLRIHSCRLHEAGTARR